MRIDDRICEQMRGVAMSNCEFISNGERVKQEEQEKKKETTEELWTGGERDRRQGKSKKSNPGKTNYEQDRFFLRLAERAVKPCRSSSNIPIR